MLLVVYLLVPVAHSQVVGPRSSSIDTIAGGEPASIPGPEFSLTGISGLASDLAGNVYFSIQSRNRVYRLGTDGHVTTYAGNGVYEKHVDDVLATSSPLFGPSTLAADAMGNIYIACLDGLVSVDADSRMLSSVFPFPYKQSESTEPIHDIEGMAIGSDGKLYLSDGGDHRVKGFSFATRTVTVLAGNGKIGQTQSGGAATSSPLKYPAPLAVASDGTIYFATLEPAVFSISPEDGKLREFSLKLPGEDAPLGDYDIPHSIVLDQDGNLFVAQGNRSRVLRISLETAAISLFAGTGAQGFDGDGARADRAELMVPTKLAISSSGDLVVGELSNIRSVDLSSHLISTVVGRNPASVADVRSEDPALKLSEPAIAVPTPNGSLYIVSSFSNRLLRLERNGNLASAAGGGDFISMDTKPGAADRVALDYPQGLWFDSNGDAYFSDDDNRIVRRLDVHTGVVSNFATTPKNFHSAGGFLYFAGALVGDENFLFLSDPNAGCVWRISRYDGSVELYAGLPPASMGPAQEGAGLKLAAPAGLALDAAGNLYIADGYLESKEGRILRLESGTQKITTVLSNLRQPSSLAFQSPGVLCFSETGAHQVRCLKLENGSIRVVVGTGKAGLSGDGGPAECAQLNRPMGISFDSLGNLYIADTGNQRIRLVHPGTTATQCPPNHR